jgi:two-component system, cell cycle sensor histidine kinase and response regulator CckA
MNATTPIPWPKPSVETNASLRFRAIFERAPIAVARCDARGFVVQMNPAFEGAFGCAHSGGLRLSDLVPTEDRDEIDSGLRSVFSLGHDCVEIGTRGTDDSQTRITWTLWSQDVAGEVSDHALLVAAKIVDANTTEESNLQLQRWQAMGRLAGGVVHDFNNLLTGVMLYCDLLLSSLDGRDRRRRYANEIRSALVQAAGLVAQLLVFARPKSPSAGPRSLNETVETMRELLRRLIGENIELDLHLDPNLGVVNIDPVQAQEVLLNLVLNARDALPNGGRITVQTSNCRFQPITATIKPVPFPCILLIVGDNGEGMSTEARQRLFEPFFTTKNAGQGTGLGLSTVRNIVTSHGGLIHFESELGQGTRVLVVFPRALIESAAPAPSSSAFPPLNSTEENTKESQL